MQHLVPIKLVAYSSTGRHIFDFITVTNLLKIGRIQLMVRDFKIFLSAFFSFRVSQCLVIPNDNVVVRYLIF